MCGYIRRHISTKQLNDFMGTLGLANLINPNNMQGEPEHFYPAFGGAAWKQIEGLIICENNELKAVDATWWFECNEHNGELVVDNARTTFNARNLASAYWKAAIRHRRAIVVATAIGEAKDVAGKKHAYLMESETPILLGAVYRSFPNGLYSTAVITRNAHPRFETYHEKAFPLFLPLNPEVLKIWLSDAPETHPTITHLLESPKAFNSFKITPVKTFKGGVAIGLPEYFEADS